MENVVCFWRIWKDDGYGVCCLFLRYLGCLPYLGGWRCWYEVCSLLLAAEGTTATPRKIYDENDVVPVKHSNASSEEKKCFPGPFSLNSLGDMKGRL